MNETINNQIQQVGFYQGNILNFLNQKEFQKVKNIINKVDLNNFKSSCHTGWEKDWSHDEFEKLNELKDKLVNIEQVGHTIWQYWFFQSSIVAFDDEERNFLKGIFEKIIKLCYPTKLIGDEYLPSIEITLFNKDCFIDPHQDGSSGMKLCNVLIYTNEDYIEGKGGELEIDGNLIKPEIGNFVVLDFHYVNPSHKVNKVIADDFNRIAFISSASAKTIL